MKGEGKTPKDATKDIKTKLGKNLSFEHCGIIVLENIETGEAYNKLKEMVQNQGGDISYLEDTTKFEKSKYISAVVSEKTGKVKEINAEDIEMFKD